MAENPKAPIVAETNTPASEIAKLRAKVVELEAKIERQEHDAGIMRAALDQAREEGRLGGLPKDAVQLAESLTVVEGAKLVDGVMKGGKLVDARPGDVLLPDGGNFEAFRKSLPAHIRALVVSKEEIADARARKLIRS